MADKLMYLASPYSHKDINVCVERFRAICRFAAKAIAEGYNVYSPIAHSHSIAMHGEVDHLAHELWMKQDMVMLPRCDELWVCMMDGWENSDGMKMEIAYAKEHDIPVHFMEAI